MIGRPLLIYWSAKVPDGEDSAEAAPPGGKLFSLRPIFDRWLGIRWRRMLRLVESWRSMAKAARVIRPRQRP